MYLPRAVFVLVAGLFACFVLRSSLTGRASAALAKAVQDQGLEEPAGNQSRRLQGVKRPPVHSVVTTDVTVEWFSDSTCATPSVSHGGHKTIFRKAAGSRCVFWEYFRLGEQSSGFKYVKLDANNELKMYNTVGCAGRAIYTFDPSWLGLLRCPSSTCMADGTLYKKVSGTGFDLASDVSPTCKSVSNIDSRICREIRVSGAGFAKSNGDYIAKGVQYGRTQFCKNSNCGDSRIFYSPVGWSVQTYDQGMHTRYRMLPLGTDTDIIKIRPGDWQLRSGPSGCSYCGVAPMPLFTCIG